MSSGDDEYDDLVADKKHDQANISLACICGRIIGTTTGWDQTDAFALILYNVVSNNDRIPSGDVSFNFETGEIETYAKDGTVTWKGDLIDTLHHFPKENN